MGIPAFSGYGHNAAWNNINYLATYRDNKGHSGSAISVYCVHKYKDVFGKVVNKTITMDTALVIKDGRVYAPIKYLANAFARDAKWDGTKREITLQAADFESPFE